MSLDLRPLVSITLFAITAAIGCGGEGDDTHDSNADEFAAASSDSTGESSDSSSDPNPSTSESAGSESDTQGNPDDSDTGDTGEPEPPTYYVSMMGDDQNPGTLTEPWRTVQHAADTLVAGDRVIVMNGDYDEAVVIEGSGLADARIRYVAQNRHGARLRGVVIRADHVIFDGFEIEADLETETGVFVDGGHGVRVNNCWVHECPWGGIDVSGANLDALSSEVEVVGNLLEHNGQWGIHVVGSHVLVEGNEIADTVQHHFKGDPAGSTGHDADGLRIFGDHHTIRANYIHGIADPSDPEHNIDPHADCLQTWDRQDLGGRPVMTDTLIEGNHCVVEHPSGKGIIMEAAYAHACHDITIRNNIFEFRDEGIGASEGTFANLVVQNNVFKAQLDDGSWGVSITMNAGVAGYDVRNNIMVDCHTESRKILSAEGIVDYNLVWFSNGAAPGGTPGAQAHELWGVDPRFVDYDGSVGGDYHLQADSPAIDAGASLPDVATDYEGAARPQGLGHDIGAFER